jgi:hypothetical protein
VGTLAKTQNGFDSVVTGIVGFHIKKGKGELWFRDKEPADMEARYTVLMPTMMCGGINWSPDGKVESISAADVVSVGVPKSPPTGYRNYYTSVMLMDEDGLICTFSSSSYGGKSAFEALIAQFKLRGQQAFPVVKLSSRPRGDMYGTIDPVFAIDDWVPASQFAAIAGGEPEQKTLAAPNPGPEKSKTAKSKEGAVKLTVGGASVIVDDEIPF